MELKFNRSSQFATTLGCGYLWGIFSYVSTEDFIKNAGAVLFVTCTFVLWDTFVE